MKCKCGGDTKVIDSRPQGHSTKRRRECEECGNRFNSYEVLEHELGTEKDRFLRRVMKEMAWTRKMFNDIEKEYFDGPGS